ncbi:Acyl-protein thioesterase 1 [Manis javanica]|nr:Acyl-protein thioesterase 1 [Manis javanica]
MMMASSPSGLLDLQCRVLMRRKQEGIAGSFCLLPAQGALQPGASGGADRRETAQSEDGMCRRVCFAV